MKKVPFFNYPELYNSNKKEFLKIFDEVASRGAYILQNDIVEFEKSIANYCNVKHAIGVANATDALEMAFHISGIKEGDEVILPSHTMTASPSAVIANKGIPILVDCNEEGMINPDLIEEKITQKTKYIMPVQLNGRTCKMEKIISLAEKYHLTIIEDSAQGLGSTYRGKQAGTFGLAGVFSFYPAKILGTFGDGGMIITNDDTFAEKCFKFRDHGRSNLDCEMWGRNSRLHNLHAAFLNFQFKSFNKTIQRRREVAKLYHKYLVDESNIKLPLFDDDNHFDTFQNFEVLVNKRDQLKEFLAINNIGTIIQWGGKAIHQFERLGLNHFDLPQTDKYFENCLMLPMNLFISNDDVKYVSQKIIEFYKNA